MAYELTKGEAFQAIVRLEILDVRVLWINPEEIEVFLLLDGSPSLLDFFFFLLFVRFCLLLEYGYEKAARVLMVWHYAEALL